MPRAFMPSHAAGARSALHALDRALEAHGAPQLLGLAAGEAGRLHGDAQQLLLEERHAEGPRQDRLQAGVRVRDGLAAGAAVQVGVHHLPRDRAGPDDRDLDHQVVEALGLHARKRRHLRAALDLEDADRVGALDHRVGLGVVGRAGGPGRWTIGPRAATSSIVSSRACQHAEAQQVDLDDAQVGAVVLVPLHHAPVLHGRRLDRHHLVEAPGGDHDAAGVLAQVTGQPAHLRPTRSSSMRRCVGAGGRRRPRGATWCRPRRGRRGARGWRAAWPDGPPRPIPCPAPCPSRARPGACGR